MYNVLKKRCLRFQTYNLLLSTVFRNLPMMVCEHSAWLRKTYPKVIGIHGRPNTMKQGITSPQLYHCVMYVNMGPFSCLSYNGFSFWCLFRGHFHFGAFFEVIFILVPFLQSFLF